MGYIMLGFERIWDSMGVVTLCLLASGYQGHFSRGKATGREADHSPSSSAEVKNAWNYTSTPHYVFMAWCLVKHRDNFTFTLHQNKNLQHVGSLVRGSGHWAINTRTQDNSKITA
jgi:hypothetical protein